MGHTTRRAFTLIELLLVLVILAVLASVAVPLYIHRVDEARYKITLADIRQIKTALATFQLDNGRFPTTEEGLEALVEPPNDLAGTWAGPYLEQVTTDKWGRPYRYFFPGKDDPANYTLFSAGKDGVDNTEDDITQYTVSIGAGGQ